MGLPLLTSSPTGPIFPLVQCWEWGQSMDIWIHLVNRPFGAEAARHLCGRESMFVRDATYQRKEIAGRLAQAFKEEGGDPRTSNSDVTRVLKKLLQGEALPFRKIGRGIYLFTGGSDQDNTVVEQSGDTGRTAFGEVSPEREYGEGPCEVYAWCLPMYRKPADGYCWPIKIGWAAKEGFRRRLEDFAANLPERPCYLMRLGCNDETEARKREGMLHHFFRERDDKVVDDVAGKEWFKTNPDELDEAIQVLFPRAHRAVGKRKHQIAP